MTRKSSAQRRTAALSGIIDCSAWSGDWPFLDLPLADREQLRDRLVKCGISQAWIAPTAAILNQNTHRQGMRLLRDLPAADPFWSPVPVLNPCLDDWPEALAFFLADPRVQMIKLIPNYHLYVPAEDLLEPIIARLSRPVVLAWQMRVEDERGRYAPLQIHDVEPIRVARCCQAFPQQHFLIQNAFLRELPELLRSTSNTWADLASLEIQDTLATVHRIYGLDRIVFGSHAPFYYPEGAIAKLRAADLPAEEIRKVASENAKQLLQL